MDSTSSDYHHGQQNISEQASTYALFGGLTKWGSLGVATLVLMLVLWFCTGAGFFVGAGAGFVLLAAGIWFLRSKLAEDL